MSDSPPRNRTLRRGVGARNLLGANGRPARRLMFAEAAAVRPFNFRNSVEETRNASYNTVVPLVNGRNSRGHPREIERTNIRRQPEFAEAMGTNIAALTASMAANRASRDADIEAFRQGTIAPGRTLHLPVRNVLREPGQRQSRRRAKEGRLMAAQYEMGISVPELNQLAAEGASNAYIAEEANLLRRNYNAFAAQNQAQALNAADLNTQYAQRIAEQAAEQAAARAGPSTRRSRRKTRRTRK